MRFRNVSGVTQDLPTLGDDGLRVPAGEEFEATGEAAKSLTGNPAFKQLGGAKRPAKTRTPKKASAPSAPVETPPSAETNTEDVS